MVLLSGPWDWSSWAGGRRVGGSLAGLQVSAAQEHLSSGLTLFIYTDSEEKCCFLKILYVLVRLGRAFI